MYMNRGNRLIIDRESGCKDQDIRDFDERVKGFLGDEGPFEYMVEPKLEGLTVALVYKKGGLEIASTLGNGYEGEYITANIKTLLTVPLTLVQLDENYTIPDLLTVQGDVYMEFDAFIALNQQRMERDFPPFEHPVDAVADSLRQPNPRITAKRTLNMFCSGVGEYTGPSYKTQMDSMIMLQKWGLRVNRPLFRVCPTIDKVIQYCRHLKEIRTQFPFKIDGAVIKLNRLRLQEKLVEGDGSPGWVLAFEFKGT